MERVCVGVVVRAHGVKGCMRIQSFMANPLDVRAYNPLRDREGRYRFVVQAASGVGKEEMVLANVAGIVSRSQASTLRGTHLFIPRFVLPKLMEDTFYWADLIGLTVIFEEDDTPIGIVKAMYDFGAGAILEAVVHSDKSTFMVPFIQSAVPKVDILGGRVVVIRAFAMFNPTRTPDSYVRESD